MLVDQKIVNITFLVFLAALHMSPQRWAERMRRGSAIDKNRLAATCCARLASLNMRTSAVVLQHAVVRTARKQGCGLATPAPSKPTSMLLVFPTMSIQQRMYNSD